MKSLFHLPAHPLFVHGPVVLMPLVALFAVALAIRKDWRERYVWQFVISCAVLLGATILAARSGELFNTVVRDSVPTKRHRELGETTRLIVAILFVASLAMAWATRRDRGAEAATAGNPGTASVRPSVIAGWVVGALAVLGTIWMIRTGHEGARVVWTGTLKKQ